MNRLWSVFFGTGLVETVEDFGSQGQNPTHPDLLDWLSVEFVNEPPEPTARDQNTNRPPAWDVKRLQRLIVSSATYRQSSRVTSNDLEQDPANRLLGRGPRFRLSAETIRDNALNAAELLVDRIGGPSVSPYQPDGLWDDVAVGADYEGTTYKQDKGEGLYRRSMYTFWKRTCPPPGLNTFDAPEREVCTARRSRTNTPLQALVLLNDPTYIEAARQLAEQSIKSSNGDPKQLVEAAFRRVVARKPSEAESRSLLKTYQRQLERFISNTDSAEKLLTIGESTTDSSASKTELAAWTTVMSVILNLDEAITKN
ncbi:MAG: DUF1553 domain-containing protein [Planctomycetes bacterium]|nr:DUF1553 domain-containing protein [Planctomycetota bacterium]